MLVNPVRFVSSPILQIIAPGNPVRLATGVFQITHFSGDMLLWGKNDLERSYDFDVGDVPISCVCDSVEQFLRKYESQLEADPRPFVVFMTHIPKDESNRGQGGGWRWHKWGEYVGEGNPSCEYLDDEDGFSDGVFVVSVLLADNVIYLT